jgi:hypothetical protein
MVGMRRDAPHDQPGGYGGFLPREASVNGTSAIWRR